MPKARLLRPEFWTDDKVVGVDPLARLLFAGMWNFACDNGHLDDSTIQLKIRILPADSCDIDTLLDSLLAAGLVIRKDGYLKVVNLPKQQPLDIRYLVFCDHCDNDPESHYSRSDKRSGRGSHASGTRATREQHASGPGRGDGDGDGDGGVKGGVGGRPATAARKRAHPIPDDWTPNDKHTALAAERGLNLTVESDRFRDSAIAKGRTYVDWDAAFRNWLNSPYAKQSQREESTWAKATVIRADEVMAK